MGEVRLKIPRLMRVKGRYYWRPATALKTRGFRVTALGTDLEQAIAKAKVLNLEADAGKQDIALAKAAPGTVKALIAAYQVDPLFTSLAPATQKQYRRILREIESREGTTQVSEFERADLKAIYRAAQQRGLATANAIIRVWRLLFSYAMDAGEIDSNPASKMRLAGIAPRSRIWTLAEIEKFHAAAMEKGRPSVGLAVLLAWDLGQRQSDILRLTWSDWNGTTFSVRQGKTGARVQVPISDEVRHIVESTVRTSTQVVVSEATGKPFKPDHFRHEFAAIRDAAGLPTGLQFRDLRRTAATELGDAGATDDEIRSVTGHLSRNIVAVYVRPTSVQAEAAQNKRRTKVQTRLP